LDAVGDALRLDVRRFPFTIGHRGTTLEERVALVEAVHRDLLARDLVRDAEFAPDLVELLRLFAHAPLGISLVGTDRDTSLLALAVSDRRDGVLAVQQGEVVEFQRHSSDTVVPALVELLPELPPGPGSAVAVHAPAPKPSDEDFSHFRFTAGVRPAPTAATAVAEILRRPRTGAGYFTVVARKGHRETELGTASYLDTDAGRWAVLSGSAPNGTPNATFVPMDRWSIGRHLSSFLTSTG
jgi:hypothetical protein